MLSQRTNMSRKSFYIQYHNNSNRRLKPLCQCYWGECHGSVCVDKTLLSRNRGKRRERKSWASFPVSRGFNWPVGGREREREKEGKAAKERLGHYLLKVSGLVGHRLNFLLLKWPTLTTWHNPDSSSTHTHTHTHTHNHVPQQVSFTTPLTRLNGRPLHLLSCWAEHFNCSENKSALTILPILPSANWRPLVWRKHNEHIDLHFYTLRFLQGFIMTLS